MFSVNGKALIGATLSSILAFCGSANATPLTSQQASPPTIFHFAFSNEPSNIITPDGTFVLFNQRFFLGSALAPPAPVAVSIISPLSAPFAAPPVSVTTQEVFQPVANGSPLSSLAASAIGFPSFQPATLFEPISPTSSENILETPLPAAASLLLFGLAGLNFAGRMRKPKRL